MLSVYASFAFLCSKPERNFITDSVRSCSWRAHSDVFLSMKTYDCSDFSSNSRWSLISRAALKPRNTPHYWSYNFIRQCKLLSVFNGFQSTTVPVHNQRIESTQKQDLFPNTCMEIFCMKLCWFILRNMKLIKWGSCNTLPTLYYHTCSHSLFMGLIFCTGTTSKNARHGLKHFQNGTRDVTHEKSIHDLIILNLWVEKRTACSATQSSMLCNPPLNQHRKEQCRT